jgi:YhcH/YjgK/YiaL family protein
MIVTDLRHIERDVFMTPALRKAVDFLRRPDLPTLPDGKVTIDGEGVFGIVQRYETSAAAEVKFEHHRKYMDIQFIVSGKEIIGWAPAGQMTITEAYDADRDIAFGSVPEKWTPVYLTQGQAALFYPWDAHAPKLAAGNTSQVMKIVVKVSVSS